MGYIGRLIRRRKPRDSNLVSHAKRELALLALIDPGDEMQAQMNAHLVKIVRMFAEEGHSGFSASYATSVLEKLLRFEPLKPLTGEPEEWVEVGAAMGGEPCWQNNRCSHVFKDETGAYDINGIVWREPDGGCFTNFESRVPVTFPYTPATEYRDRPIEAA